jgi:hypothetical protein
MSFLFPIPARSAKLPIAHIPFEERTAVRAGIFFHFFRDELFHANPSYAFNIRIHISVMNVCLFENRQSVAREIRALGAAGNVMFRRTGAKPVRTFRAIWQRPIRQTAIAVLRIRRTSGAEQSADCHCVC